MLRRLHQLSAKLKSKKARQYGTVQFSEAMIVLFQLRKELLWARVSWFTLPTIPVTCPHSLARTLLSRLELFFMELLLRITHTLVKELR
mmetsp:Transcript_43702/g.120988  ORF Transcript_43702/g.120988 Transcript_43702/m.120988 type:complete len:89 (-) Transcript_43702:467-733(-)